MAASIPSTAAASVRAISTRSGSCRAAKAALTLLIITSAGTTCFPVMCPHRFGATWSSMCMAATPAASYSCTVRITLIALP